MVLCFFFYLKVLQTPFIDTFHRRLLITPKLYFYSICIPAKFWPLHTDYLLYEDIYYAPVRMRKRGTR